MCYWCYVEQDDDSEAILPPPAPTPETDRLVELVDQLYRQPGCGLGGPLHCELDDWNLDSETITPSYGISGYEGRPAAEDAHAPKVHELCEEIAAIMNRMTVEQREYALAVHDGYVKTEADTGD